MKRTVSALVPALAFALAMAGTADAQFASPGATIAASGIGGMSCAEFTHMSPRHREAVVRHAWGAASSGLASITVQPRIGDRMVTGRDTGSVPGTPLSAGMIISACQAAAPSASVGDAYRQANSGGGSLRLGLFR
ncbi:MAG TPA: hypothetical protein VHB23_16955 [Devosiaceae bacterium]|jgi:hypothetical protein|nr:hypothetical protein [Devosiaceae bacterium]